MQEEESMETNPSPGPGSGSCFPYKPQLSCLQGGATYLSHSSFSNSPCFQMCGKQHQQPLLSDHDPMLFSQQCGQPHEVYQDWAKIFPTILLPPFPALHVTQSAFTFLEGPGLFSWHCPSASHLFACFFSCMGMYLELQRPLCGMKNQV